MSVRVEWDDERHIAICQIYSGHVTLDDYIAATDQVAAMVSTVSHTVHSIMDRSRITQAPSTSLPALFYANRKLPENLGLRVIINPSVYTRMVVNIGRRIAPRVIQQVHFAISLEDAREIIQQHLDAQESLTSEIH